MAKDKENNLLNEIEEVWTEDISFEDDDILPELETSFDRETLDYNYEIEDDYSSEEEIQAIQLNDSISFDSIKLKLSLTDAEYVKFSVSKNDFFRSSKPEKPTKEDETKGNLITLADDPVKTMELTPTEENHANRDMEYQYAKQMYPNAKPFADYTKRLGVGHMYFKDGCFICQINGKITAKEGSLGLINKANINDALNKLKGYPQYNLLKFDNEKFIEKAEVLLVHATNDIKVTDVNSNIKAFSSILPIRTDKFSVLKYGNCGYEVLPRGKQSENTAKQSFCIYSKAEEIIYSNPIGYKNNIGRSGIRLAGKVLRLEFKLYNYKAIRKYFAPELEKGTITLKELLNSNRTPIKDYLAEIGITIDNFRKLPTVAEFHRIYSVIPLLALNDYSFDKLRSHVEVETGKKMRSDELKKDREALQRYIIINKPRTVALLNKLLECISY